MIPLKFLNIENKAERIHRNSHTQKTWLKWAYLKSECKSSSMFSGKYHFQSAVIYIDTYNSNLSM